MGDSNSPPPPAVDIPIETLSLDGNVAHSLTSEDTAASLSNNKPESQADSSNISNPTQVQQTLQPGHLSVPIICQTCYESFSTKKELRHHIYAPPKQEGDSPEKKGGSPDCKRVLSPPSPLLGPHVPARKAAHDFFKGDIQCPHCRRYTKTSYEQYEDPLLVHCSTCSVKFCRRCRRYAFPPGPNGQWKPIKTWEDRKQRWFETQKTLHAPNCDDILLSF